MKKVLALVLLLVLSFSLAACGSGGDGGKKEERHLTIGFNTNNLTNETMSFMADVMQAYCDEHGITFMLSQDGGDVATMQNNLENMVAGGCDGIIFMNYDPQGIEPVILELKEKGIALVSYDESSDICDYAWTMSNYDTGYAIGKMAADWINEAIPDVKDVEVGFLCADTVVFLKERGDGIVDGLEDNCKNGVVIYRTAAPNADFLGTYASLVTAHPDIHVFTSVAGGVVVGIAEAWYGDLVGAGKDVSKYGVFSTDATDIELNLINKAKQGQAVYRGTIDLGLKDYIPLGMIECCHAAILGEDWGYPQENLYQLKLVTEENIDEYAQYLDE